MLRKGTQFAHQREPFTQGLRTGGIGDDAIQRLARRKQPRLPDRRLPQIRGALAAAREQGGKNQTQRAQSQASGRHAGGTEGVGRHGVCGLQQPQQRIFLHASDAED